MNVLDRVICSINPKAGYNRLAYKSLIERNYAAGGRGRRNTGWTTSTATAEVTNRADRDIVRARARDLERNDPLMVAAVLAHERNVVGTGIRLQAKVTKGNDEEDDDLNTRIEEAWERWGRVGACEVTGTMSLSEVEKMCVRRKLVDGGIFVLEVIAYDKYMLQLKEVDDLDLSVLAYGSRKVVGGVEVDEYLRPLAYHFKEFDVLQVYSGKTIRVPADRVYYLASRTRPSGVREFCPQAASLTKMDDSNQLLEAALMKERTQAYFALAVESEIPQVGAVGRGIDGGGRPVGASQGQSEPLEMGSIKHLAPGEKIHTINPQGVSSTAGDMMRQIHRLVGSGTGLSYESLSRDLSQVNYSSARQGLLEDRKTYQEWQKYLVDHLLFPVYCNWLDWMVLSGQIKIAGYFANRERYQKTKWIPCGWEWIDPLKEAAANERALGSGQTTLQDICAAKGQDYRDVIAQRAKERKLIAELDAKNGGTKVEQKNA